MQPTDKLDFFCKFFHFTSPLPLRTTFTQEDLKNNDMKITLQIATRSTLRMQSDPKTNLVSFSCKNFGKNCYEIFAIKQSSHYLVETNYAHVTHRRNCQLKNESFEYLKIYNLMKLNKNLIESVMIKSNLFHSSPSEILGKISDGQEYFFEKNINYNAEMRRKLRKRFDNIINIDIKKITKGGREEMYEQLQSNEQPEIIGQVKENNQPQINQRQIQKKTRKTQAICKIEQSESQFDETSFFDETHKIHTKKKPINKKKDKNKKKPYPKKTSTSRQNKQNNWAGTSQSWIKKPIEKAGEDEIYENPASVNELKQIKELNQEFHGYDGGIFGWSSEEPYEQVVQMETINDKLRQNVFLSLRNSLLKRPLEGQSLENMTFPENIGFGHSQDSFGHMV